MNGQQAAAAVEASDLNAAIQRAVADSNGNKHVHVELKSSTAAGSYALELPAANLTNRSASAYLHAVRSACFDL